jgi:hypothetical protein
MVTCCHIIVSLESIDYFESRKAAGPITLAQIA